MKANGVVRIVPEVIHTHPGQGSLNIPDSGWRMQCFIPFRLDRGYREQALVK